MVLGAHAVVGGAIGAIVRGHPVLAFVYGFISHFLLDMIPHWDYPIRSGFVDPHGESKVIKWKQVSLDILSVGCDIFVGLSLSFIFFGQGGDATYAWAWGTIGAIVPDALQFAYGLWKKPPLSWLQKIHEGIHTPIRFKDHPVIGSVVQVLFVVLVIVGMHAYNDPIRDHILVPAFPEVVAREKAPISTTTIAFVGDIMLGRNVEVLYRREGVDYSFRNIQPYLNQFDYVIGNLEGPIRENHTRTPAGSFSFSFDPLVAPLLASSTIDAVSLANNHTFDGGVDEYWATATYLVKSGIGYFGHPTKAASSSFQVYTPQIDVEVVGFNATYPSFVLEDAMRVVSEASYADQKKMVIVFMHWGDEYEPIHNSAQSEIAESLIESGASLIIGAHPHVVQDIEVVNGVPVVYSLGNFIFDQYFSKETQEGLLAEVVLHGDKALLRIHPLVSKKSQPEPGIGDIREYSIPLK